MRKYRSFEKARQFARSLGLRTTLQWKAYAKSDAKPGDIPATPQGVYENQGWSGIRDWLGSEIEDRYLSFEEARVFARSLGLVTKEQWRQFARSSEKPENIPGAPERLYGERGWDGFPDWLGYEAVHVYLSFKEARAYVHALGLVGRERWQQYAGGPDKPRNVPCVPWRVYKDTGWAGISDWLGTKVVRSPSKSWRSFAEARRFVWALKLATGTEWTRYSLGNDKPADIPANPAYWYKQAGWSGLRDWIGTKDESWARNRYRSFAEAQEFAQTLGLSSIPEWLAFARGSDCPSNIPADPASMYKAEGWASWGDFLGTGNVANTHKNYRSFQSARAFAQTLNLRTIKQWMEFARGPSMPADIPTTAARYYRERGWVSWQHFLRAEN